MKTAGRGVTKTSGTASLGVRSPKVSRAQGKSSMPSSMLLDTLHPYVEVATERRRYYSNLEIIEAPTVDYCILSLCQYGVLPPGDKVI